MKTLNPRILAKHGLLPLLLLSLIQSAQAANSTWSGAAGGDWTVAGNWDAVPLTDGTSSLIFAGANVTNNNAFTANTTFAGITFDNTAGAFTLAGNAITLGGNIVNNDADLQTINLNMIVGVQRLITATSGNIAIGGAISSVGNFGITKTGAKTLTLSGNNTYTGATYANGGRILMTGGTIGGTTGTPQLYVGTSVGAGTAGAMRQTGGSITLNSTTSNQFLVGHGSKYGAYELAGGTLQVNDTDGGFRGSVRDAGVFFQTGGTFNMNNAGSNGQLFQIGGVVYATGGTSTITGATAATTTINAGTLGAGVQLTIGGTADWNNTGVVNVASLPLNLIGTGRLTVMSLTGAGNLNFNGGTLRAGQSSTSFLTGLSATTIYSGGATIDTNGKNITVGQNLLAPTGSGLATVPLTSVGSGYIGAPQVSISGGGGTGATAVADYDPATGLITGVTITNPGTGYTSAPTVTFSTPAFTPTVAAVVGTPTIAANATTGGLTKSGTGILTLSGTNTYGGNTTLSTGTLSIATTGALPGWNTNGRFSVANATALAVYNAVGDADIATLLGTTNFAAGSSIGFDTTTADRAYTANITDTAQGMLGLVKLGANTLTLSGTNTYTGTTIVSAGVLSVSSTSALPGWDTNGRFSVASGAMLAVVNSFSDADFATIRATTNFAAGAGFGFDTSAGDRIYSGNLTGSVGVAKAGANTLTLTGTTSYTGVTAIAGGTLKLVSALTTSGALQMSGSGILDLNGNNAKFITSAGLSNTGTGTNTITDNAADTGTSVVFFSNLANQDDKTMGALITDGATRKVGVKIANANYSKSLLTNANNTYSGGTTFTALDSYGTRYLIEAYTPTLSGSTLTKSELGTGTIYVGANATDKASVLINPANKTFYNDIVWDGLGTNEGKGQLVFGGGGSSTFNGTQTLNTDLKMSSYGAGSTNAVINGKVTGNGGLTLAAPAPGFYTTLTLQNAAGTNDYAGLTNINRGSTGANIYGDILVLGANNQIPDGTGKGNVNVNGTLRLNGFSDTINGLTGGITIISTIPTITGRVENNSATASTLTLGANDTTASFTGNIVNGAAGTLAITKIGTGTQTFSGANTYTGNTTVSAGTLSLTGSLTGSNVSTSGTGILTQSAAGVIAGSGTTFTQGSSGTSTLSGANTYGGNTTISTGILDITTTSALPGWNTNGRFSVASGATLAVYNAVGDADIATLLGTTNFAAGSSIGFDTTTADRAYTANITNTAQGMLGLVKIGANTLTLSGTNTYTGNTIVSAGILSVSSTSALPGWDTNGRFSVASGAMLAVGNSFSDADVVTMRATTNFAAGSGFGFDTSAGDRIYSGDLTGAMGVAKVGANTLTLTGTTSYTGGTAISGGTLKLVSALTTGALTMTNAAILDLNGNNATFTNTGNPGSTTSAATSITDNAAGSGTSTLRFVDGPLNGTSDGAITDGATRKIAVEISNHQGYTQRLKSSNSTYSGGTVIDNNVAGSRLQISSYNPTLSGLTLTKSEFGTGAITIGKTATDKASLYFDTGTAGKTFYNGITFNTPTGLDASWKGVALNVAGITLAGTQTANLSDAIYETFTPAGQSATITGQITGSQGLSVGPLAYLLNLTLANAAGTNDYVGATKIGVAGIVTLGANNQLPDGTGKGNVNVVGTLRLNGFSDTINGLTGTGTVQNNHATTASTLTLGAGDATESFDGLIADGVGAKLSLVKIGTGTQTLTGAVSIDYTGNTTVEAGTLVIRDSYLDPASSVSLGASAVLNLNFDEPSEDVTATVDKLFINGVQQPVGVYGATGSGATTVNDVNFAGVGTLTVLTGPAVTNNYASWASDNGISGQPFDGDFDKDGISNGVEYALGKSPTTSSQPAGVLAGNTLTFTKGAAAIANGDVSWIIETSTTLTGWSAEVTQAAGDPAATIAYTFTPGTPAKKFARLKVVQVP